MIIFTILFIFGLIATLMVRSMAKAIYEVMDEIDED
jgi:hypothetical protein